MKSDVANQPPIIPKLGSVEPKPLRSKMLLDAIHHRIALLAIQAFRQKLHHAEIGIDLRKRSSIAAFPLSQPKSLRFQHRETLPFGGRRARQR
jgi:hypothetical protein